MAVAWTDATNQCGPYHYNLRLLEKEQRVWYAYTWMVQNQHGMNAWWRWNSNQRDLRCPRNPVVSSQPRASSLFFDLHTTKWWQMWDLNVLSALLCFVELAATWSLYIRYALLFSRDPFSKNRLLLQYWFTSSIDALGRSVRRSSQLWTLCRLDSACMEYSSLSTSRNPQSWVHLLLGQSMMPVASSSNITTARLSSTRWINHP